MTLGGHLRANYDIYLAVTYRLDKRLGRFWRANSIARQQRKPRFGKSYQNFFGKPFNPGATSLHLVFCPAGLAIIAWSRFMTAMVTAQTTCQPMRHHP